MGSPQIIQVFFDHLSVFQPMGTWESHRCSETEERCQATADPSGTSIPKGPKIHVVSTPRKTKKTSSQFLDISPRLNRGRFWTYWMDGQWMDGCLCVIV